MMDVSDGLAIDLSRLARASHVGARVVLGDVPVAAGATLDDALGGGEDYELLAALPGDGGRRRRPRASCSEGFGVPLTEIGRIVDDEGLTAIEADGTERPLEPTGWDHFR